MIEMIGPTEFVEDYVVQPFRTRQLKDRYVVTVETGGWAVLNKKELKLLENYELKQDPKLFASLVMAG
ncbi:MAG: hypothetical protein GOU99_01805, partial [Candidatus Altiarchaeota archaeon]|nr:hypothetical protein [Candidatus Altiarchaeota archaeon]